MARGHHNIVQSKLHTRSCASHGVAKNQRALRCLATRSILLAQSMMPPCMASAPAPTPGPMASATQKFSARPCKPRLIIFTVPIVQGVATTLPHDSVELLWVDKSIAVSVSLLDHFLELIVRETLA